MPTIRNICPGTRGLNALVNGEIKIVLIAPGETATIVPAPCDEDILADLLAKRDFVAVEEAAAPAPVAEPAPAPAAEPVADQAAAPVKEAKGK